MSQMTKQIEIHGQRLQLYSLDNGHTWSSSPHSIAAYRQRKKIALGITKKLSTYRGDAGPRSEQIWVHLRFQ
jgi:hypothetical protein